MDILPANFFALHVANESKSSKMACLQSQITSI